MQPKGDDNEWLGGHCGLVYVFISNPAPVQTYSMRLIAFSACAIS